MRINTSYIKYVALINFLVCTICFGQNSVELDQTIRKMSEEAKNGIAESQFQLGILYRNGKGVPIDFKIAFMWIKKSAEQGYTNAQATIARMYEQGHGTKKNKPEAIKWWRIAANKGNPFAQAALGFYYLRGDGLPKDLIAAEKWLLLASKNNDPMSQFLLALLYDNCKHQTSFIKKTLEFGCMDSDIRPFLNPDKAAKWYRKAADAAFPNAQFALGLMLSEGQFIPQDNIEATMWLHLAFSILPPSKDRDEAYKAFIMVKQKLSYEEELRAKDMTRHWKPKLIN